MLSNSEIQGELLSKVFSALEARSVPYVVIHSYENLPGKVDSDVDIATSEQGLGEFRQVMREGHEANRWFVVQYWKHEICACGCLLVDSDNPEVTLFLDVCSDYVARQRVLVPASTLLEGRSAYGSFYIPRPAAEAAYLFAKGIVKNKNASKVTPRVQSLAKSASDDCEESLATVANRPLEVSVLAKEFGALKTADLGRSYRLQERMDELIRKGWRLLSRKGFHVCVISAESDHRSKFADQLCDRVGHLFMKSIVIDPAAGGRLSSVFALLSNLIYVHLVVSTCQPGSFASFPFKTTSRISIDIDQSSSAEDAMERAEAQIFQYLVGRIN